MGVPGMRRILSSMLTSARRPWLLMSPRMTRTTVLAASTCSVSDHLEFIQDPMLTTHTVFSTWHPNEELVNGAPAWKYENMRG